MTIDREDGGFIVQCDTCLDVYEEVFKTFRAALNWVRLSAWVPETDDDGETWTHRCTDCIAPAEGRLEKAREMFGVVDD